MVARLMVAWTFLFAAATASGVVKEDLTTAVREELSHPVHPGGVEGRPFWNGNAILFMYPPAFDFKPLGKAVGPYRFEVVGSDGKMRIFRAPTPTAALTPVWNELPEGFTTVICRGEKYGRPGRGITVGTRAFWKSAAFTGSYPPPKRKIAEAAKLALYYVLDDASTKYLVEKGEPDPSFKLNSYPSKMMTAIANACCTIAERDSVRRDEAIRAARAAVDWMIANAEPEGRPLAHFPPTYRGTGNKAAQYAGQVMLVYPAKSARAYLRLYGVCGEAKYLAAAEAVAGTYLKLQGADGSWPLKMRFSDGATICSNRLVTVGMMLPLFDRLHELTGKDVYRKAAARAFENLERTRLDTWDWEGQFEDVDPNDPYQDMTFHDAAATVIYFCQKFPKDPVRMAQARELMRFIEDQFVCWEKPYVQMDYPTDTSMCDLRTWTTPCTLEQYWWYNPIDSSAAKAMDAFLALYAVEKRPLDFAKAQALGEAITRVQWNDGGIPTHWAGNETRDSIWINCHVGSALALDALAQATGGTRGE